MRNAVLILQRRLRAFIAKARRVQSATQDDLVKVTLSEHESVPLTVEASVVPCDLPLYVNTCSTTCSSWFMPFVQLGYGLLLRKPTVMEYDFDMRIKRAEGIASLRRIEQVREILLSSTFDTKASPKFLLYGIHL